ALRRDRDLLPHGAASADRPGPVRPGVRDDELLPEPRRPVPRPAWRSWSRRLRLPLSPSASTSDLTCPRPSQAGVVFLDCRLQIADCRLQTEGTVLQICNLQSAIQ